MAQDFQKLHGSYFDPLNTDLPNENRLRDLGAFKDFGLDKIKCYWHTEPPARFPDEIGVYLPDHLKAIINTLDVPLRVKVVVSLGGGQSTAVVRRNDKNPDQLKKSLLRYRKINSQSPLSVVFPTDVELRAIALPITARITEETMTEKKRCFEAQPHMALFYELVVTLRIAEGQARVFEKLRFYLTRGVEINWVAVPNNNNAGTDHTKLLELLRAQAMDDCTSYFFANIDLAPPHLKTSGFMERVVVVRGDEEGRTNTGHYTSPPFMECVMECIAFEQMMCLRDLVRLVDEDGGKYRELRKFLLENEDPLGTTFRKDSSWFKRDAPESIFRNLVEGLGSIYTPEAYERQFLDDIVSISARWGVAENLVRELFDSPLAGGEIGQSKGMSQNNDIRVNNAMGLVVALRRLLRWGHARRQDALLENLWDAWGMENLAVSVEHYQLIQDFEGVEGVSEKIQQFVMLKQPRYTGALVVGQWEYNKRRYMASFAEHVLGSNGITKDLPDRVDGPYKNLLPLPLNTLDLITQAGEQLKNLVRLDRFADDVAANEEGLVREVLDIVGDQNDISNVYALKDALKRRGKYHHFVNVVEQKIAIIENADDFD